MKNIYKLLVLIPLICFSCAKLDYEDKEFYKKEVYIVSSESTSATERDITGVEAHTFVDTLRIINDSYDSDTIISVQEGLSSIIFKIGIGGSLFPDQDIEVLVDFDQEAIDDYNLSKNTERYIPDENCYTSNIAYDKSKGGFPVVIKAGSASSQLRFDVPIKRSNILDYENYAFALKIKDAGEAIVSRQYHSFMVSRLDVYTQKTVDWSGFPLPKIPVGRYESVRLKANGGENICWRGIHRTCKFITPLCKPDAEDITAGDDYMIWGGCNWSWEAHAFNPSGWMYNPLYLNDQVGGTYTLYQLNEDDLGPKGFPYRSFRWDTNQETTYNNKYDPKTKTLTLYYKNVIGADYVDVLTYVDDDFTLCLTPGWIAWYTVQSWRQARDKGYNYWLPIDDPDFVDEANDDYYLSKE